MNLLADIGGTNTRCALLDGQGAIAAPAVFANASFAGLAELLAAYIARHAAEPPRRAALAVAAPVLGDEIAMSNRRWRFTQSGLRRALALDELLVVNDFAALAHALPELGPADCVQIGSGTPRSGAPLAVIGPGTGLGVATLVPAGHGWIALGGEGGHVTLPASTPREQSVVDAMRAGLGHCSAERLLSGPGLATLYATLVAQTGRAPPATAPEDVSARARAGDTLAREALAMFFAMLGTIAANLALTVGAHGGVFIGGGIVPRLLDEFRASGFRERFVDKGRFRAYLDAIPTYVITAPLPALLGLRALLRQRP